MRNSIFDYIGNLDTLIAVIVGACLATGGALVADLIQDRLAQRRRQRDAARFFGEILTSIHEIFDLAKTSQSIGDPWGRYSVNLFRTVCQEAGVYNRNRERLFDILDMKTRFQINGHFQRMTLPITAIVEESETISILQARLEDAEGLSEKSRAAIVARIESRSAFRDGGLTLASDERAKSKNVLGRLERYAKTSFQARNE